MIISPPLPLPSLLILKVLQEDQRKESIVQWRETSLEMTLHKRTQNDEAVLVNY